MTGKLRTETSTVTVETFSRKQSFNRVKKKKNHTLHLCVFVCTHINTEAVIEMFVCAGDGATGWQDGGPSLTGKPEQEEQTPY